MTDSFYYQLAAKASSDFEANEGLRIIKKFASKAKNVLDAGCGEGTRLAAIIDQQNGTGLDINKYAIKLARKKYKDLTFLTYDGSKFPFDNESFDFVYSAYVLEHTTSPFLFIDEMCRVLKKGGQLCLITPNFGAPNRRSPNSIESKPVKLLTGLLDDLFFCEDLKLTKVVPKLKYRHIDDDTTVEPYVRKIARYLTEKGLKQKDCRSLWEIDEGKSIYWKGLKKLGESGIYPFYYWGPQAFVRYQK